MMKSVVAILVSLACLAAADFLEDVTRLAEMDTPALFNEDYIGYDQHKDMYYYQDEKVRSEYKRKKYTSTKITLAGQRPDMIDREVPAAVNPFVVAQRSLIPWRSNLDRWDVRDNGRNIQYLAVYSGNKGDFVANKLRAHLLRRLANALNDQLALFDRTADEDAEGQEKLVNTIYQDTLDRIVTVLNDVDHSIRLSMRKSDATSASATVVIVTERHVITVTLGGGRVLAYDSLGKYELLTEGQNGDLFGARKLREGPLRPDIRVRRRQTVDEDGDPVEVQLLLIESPTVAKYLPDQEAFKIIIRQVNQHRYREEHEQELYSTSVAGMMSSIEKTLDGKLLEKMFDDSDATVILAGLENDYRAIH